MNSLQNINPATQQPSCTPDFFTQQWRRWWVQLMLYGETTATSPAKAPMSWPLVIFPHGKGTFFSIYENHQKLKVYNWDLYVYVFIYTHLVPVSKYAGRGGGNYHPVIQLLRSHTLSWDPLPGCWFVANEGLGWDPPNLPGREDCILGVVQPKSFCWWWREFREKPVEVGSLSDNPIIIFRVLHIPGSAILFQIMMWPKVALQSFGRDTKIPFNSLNGKFDVPSPSTLASIYGRLISWRHRIMAIHDPTWDLIRGQRGSSSIGSW